MELKSISDLVVEKIKQLETSRECDLRSSQLQEREFDVSECRDVHVSADSSPVAITEACSCYSLLYLHMSLHLLVVFFSQYSLYRLVSKDQLNILSRKCS